MECNKEEAIRVLDLAEEKFKGGHYEAAMKFALKAQKLFPSLPDLSQTLTAYRVHFIAVTKRQASGDTDWHAVLGVEPSDDHETMRQQFRKMCLLTHPDKNSRSAASDGAFKLVKQAWDVLSSPNAGPSSSSSAKEEEEEEEEEDTDDDDDGDESEREGEVDDDEDEEVWEDLEAKLKCHRCNLRRVWEFSRLGDKYLEHRCKNCRRWHRIRNKVASAEVPLPCKDCHRNLSWESYRPIGFQCSSCDSYYVVGVRPDWVPRSQRSSRSRFRPGNVSCPFCESLNKYEREDVDDGRACSVSISCKRCGLRSFIELEIEAINKRNQRRN